MVNEQYAGAVIRFSGIVQGVGFRPFVFKNARRFHLKGSVCNTGTGVLIKIDGEKRNIERFFKEVCTHPPVLAEIHTSSLSYSKPHGFKKFTIVKSTESNAGFTPVSPDIATCSDCLHDIFNPGDRRYGYPFTNCTNCGPRFTIIRAIPYDRKNTTMSVFPMCADCLDEYEDPDNRRHHAQPNACPLCGPSLKLVYADGTEAPGNPVTRTAEMLYEGKIVAVKGLGGYHLAVYPHHQRAVQLLRERKKRQGKPFALMVKNLDTAKKYCLVDKKAETLLESLERPIVLLERAHNAASLSPEIAPDTSMLGIMLPYTPLHHILLEEGPEILIMTSANLSEEPLAFRDDDAFRRIYGIADAFLTHNRDIERPCDDSVLLTVRGMVVPIRRSRGFVPRSINIGDYEHQVFAAGAFEKNTFCVVKHGKAYLSHHIGDLDNEKSVDAYIQGVHDFIHMFQIKPAAVACDLHPDYISTRLAEDLAEKLSVPLFYIQHHHAHIASVLGEKKIEKTVIGVAFDGTGFGTNKTIWGGEFLIANTVDFERAGHFASVPMPGGEKSIIETDRMAVSYLITAYGSASNIPSFRFIEDFDQNRLRLIEKIILSGTKNRSYQLNCPLTSSCGRLFDAVSALLGLCTKPAYDAQGAILLETEACGFEQLLAPYSYTIDSKGVLHFEQMIREIVDDIKKEVSGKIISQKFHSTIILSGVEMGRRIREETGIGTVALSGGVFQNRYMIRYFIQQLKEDGFSVLFHSLVPPNDGGISLGQGIVALNRLRGGKKLCV